MKLLLFVHSLERGGTERVTATLANHWAANGSGVLIVTLADVESDRYTLHPAVRRIGLGLAHPSPSAFGALAGNWRRIAALRRILRHERPDVALAMMSTASILLAFAALRSRRMVRIGSERTHPPQVNLGRAWELLRVWTYRWLDAVVVLSSESQEWAKSNTRARRVRVIRNPVLWPPDTSEPKVSPSVVGEVSRHRLLSAGRLGEEKGYAHLIDVFSRLAPAFPDWELVILGDGPLRGALESQIRSLGLERSVFLPGYVGNVDDWHSSADLYVLTSRFEGFPNALAEAMAGGVPAVSFNCDTGPRTIIRHEIDGLLVPAGDVVSLESALERMMRCTRMRETFGERAREVSSRFAIDAVIREWDALFRELTT